jgi:hypothetical protein
MEEPLRLHTRRCECGGADCTAVIEMTWEEQDEVDHNRRWALHPDHEPQGARSWRMIRATDRFLDVEIEEQHHV